MKSNNMEKNKKMSRWLDTELGITDPPRYNLYNKELSNYYKKGDKNLKLNDKNKINELLEFSDIIKKSDIKYEDIYEKRYHKKLILESKLVQTFMNNEEFYHHYLNPKTPRYHANMLFNQIIDYCILNNYVDDDKNPLINKMMRNNFYEFCFDNSKKC
jgi:hypothetical protein